MITDDAAVGTMAATHLLSEGHRQFAFVGNEYPWSLKRETAFSQKIGEHGFGVMRFQWTRNESNHHASISKDRQEEFRRFISEMPKPAGVMCCNDTEASYLQEVCRDVNCRVPDDLAIVGVDNDSWAALRGTSLSTVAQNYPRIAQTALQVLETLIKGEPPPPSPILVPPLGVIVRSSSSVTVTPDAQVNKALAYIKEHACEPVDVEAAAKHAGLSLRMLEYRFQDLLKRSPFDEFMRLRIQRAQQMLMETDQKVEDIARECGFNNTQGFYPVFRRLTGVPPGIFRIQKRGL